MPKSNESLDYDEISKLFHLPQSEAAKELNICCTALKKRCRKLGIQRWPYRSLQSIDKMISNIESSPRTERTDIDLEYLRSKRKLILSRAAEGKSRTITKDSIRRSNSGSSSVMSSIGYENMDRMYDAPTSSPHRTSSGSPSSDENGDCIMPIRTSSDSSYSPSYGGNLMPVRSVSDSQEPISSMSLREFVMKNNGYPHMTHNLPSFPMMNPIQHPPAMQQYPSSPMHLTSSPLRPSSPLHTSPLQQTLPQPQPQQSSYPSQKLQQLVEPMHSMKPPSAKSNDLPFYQLPALKMDFMSDKDMDKPAPLEPRYSSLPPFQSMN